MKLGQTSVIVFLSRVIGSGLGFFATLYFARKLGAEVLGVYALVLTVVGWLILLADVGIGNALIKRMSEGEQQGAYLTVATVLTLILAITISLAVILGQSVLEAYVAEFDRYAMVSVAWFIITFIFVKLFYRTTVRILKGEHKVHVAGLLDPVNVGTTSLIQLGLVLLGLGLSGMLIGSILGAVIAGLTGLIWVTTKPTQPSKHHFSSLFDYAKFSWLGNLKSRAFNEVDILLLGVFVPTSVVGVYSVSWSLSKFLDLFGTAIRSSLFPEISHMSTQDSNQATARLVEDSLAYTGLIAVPGFIGGIILGDRLLRLYGQEFVDGVAVLGFLILAILLFSYQKQLMSGLNGLDRPDLAFRVNVVFITLNAVLNAILISQYGIEGAAVASVFSTGVSLGLAYYLLSQLIDFEIPYAQLLQQWAAALVMGGVVFLVRNSIETAGLIKNNAIIVITLVVLGAITYFVILFIISHQFRATINRNLPFGIPLLAR